MINVEILGIGKYLPQNTIYFGNQTRYRVKEGESQISMAVNAINVALGRANLTINDIDCIVGACAVGVQPIPCTASLVHEQIAMGKDIPAIDINTTCTSFVAALDIMSNLIAGGKYNNVIIFSSENASKGLNPKQKESYELFSDGAAAIVLGKSKNSESGIIYGMQKTWSEGAHLTEIRGGLTNYTPDNYSEETKEEYMFDMKGRKVLLLAARKLPSTLEEFYFKSGLSENDVNFIVPHQASKALPMIMGKLGIDDNKYANYVTEYGNMVSASIPVALCRSIEDGKIKKGDTIMLLGTAAGLTTNMVVLKY